MSEKPNGAHKEESPNVFAKVWEWVRVAFGFTSQKAQVKAIAGLVVVVFVGVSVFFLSYSLARHKRMVARLTSEVTKLEAVVKVRDIQLKKQKHEIDLARLKGDAKQLKKQRGILQKDIDKAEKDVTKAKDSLKVERKKIKHTKNRKVLLDKARQLVKDTL